MKVLMIIGSSQVGGAEKQFVRLVKELGTLFEITILVIGNDGPYSNIYKAVCSRFYQSHGKMLSDVYTTSKALYEVKPDVVLLWLYRASIVGSLLAKIFKTRKILITVRNTDWPGNAFWKRKLLLLSSRLATGIIANSERSALFHQSFGMNPAKFCVIRNFIDESAVFRENVTQQIETFGLAARTVSGKGHALAIEALNLVKAQGFRVRLSIAGMGVETWQDLGSLLESSELETELVDNRIHLDTWFQNIDCCLALSDSWDSDSNFVIESICRGIPVVCSPNQTLEDISELQRVVTPFTANSVAQNVIRLILLPAERRQHEILAQRQALELLRNPKSIVNQWAGAFLN